MSHMTVLTVLALGLFAQAMGQSYPYGEVLATSNLYYEAQRSGPLPADNRVDWRGDSALDDAVVGGYYDAGDHVKFGFPMASMTTILAWGGLTFKAGYDAAGETDNLKKTIQWSTDYFLAAHVADNELIGQIGDGDADHAYWGRPEDMTMARPDFRITGSAGGSDLAGETAAALAASSMFYDSIGESSMADDCLDHARTLFDFADTVRAKYTDSIPEAANFYNSWSGYNDELYWSAAWLYKATGEQTYLDKADNFFETFGFSETLSSDFSWDNKQIGGSVLMYEATGDSKYLDAINGYITFVKNDQYTPGGLLFVDMWGSLRHAANIAHLFLQVAELGVEVDYCNDFAETQINYILGDTGRSFVVGWGVNPPVMPHHRAASCPDMPEECGWDDYESPNANPQTITGALVGGPDENDVYVDARSDFQHNEIATDYNAGFQGALAGLTAKYA